MIKIYWIRNNILSYNVTSLINDLYLVIKDLDKEIPKDIENTFKKLLIKLNNTNNDLNNFFQVLLKIQLLVTYSIIVIQLQIIYMD
jgi:hypothetical protein